MPIPGIGLPILATKLLGSVQQGGAAAPSAIPSALPAPPSIDPKDQAVRALFSRLSETELSSILGCLGATSQIALAELHRAFQEANPAPADVMARHLAVRKFLKSLSEQELSAIFASLSDTNRQLLIALYSEYRKLEEEEQSRKPEILRS